MIDMSETKIGAVFTVVDPITIDGKPLVPGDHVIYVGTVYLPNRTVEWKLPPIENAEDSPMQLLRYGFSFGGILHTEIDSWNWTINGTPHDPRPENLVPIEKGGRHDIVITVILKETVEQGRKFTLTATISRGS